MSSLKEKVTTSKSDKHKSADYSFKKKQHIGKNVTVPTYKSNFIILLVLVVYILFNLLAAFIFIQIEKNPTEGKSHWLPKLKEEFLNNHSSCISIDELEAFLSKLDEAKNDGVDTLQGNSTTYPVLWTLNNAFVLSFTIASTIGYGIVTPVTAGGQIWAIVFAFISIPFTGLLAAKMGIIMAHYIKQAATRALGLEPKAKYVGLFFTLLFGTIVYIVVPSIILTFVSNEEKWTFVNCLYCVIITLTTIGFGDYVPDPSVEAGIGGSIAVLIWVVAGLAWFASIVQLIASQMSRQVKSLRKRMSVPNAGLIKHFHNEKKSEGAKLGSNQLENNQRIEEEKRAGGDQRNLNRSKSLCTEVQSNGSTLVEITQPIPCNCDESEPASYDEDEDNIHHRVNVEVETNDEEINGPGSFHAVVMTHMKGRHKTDKRRIGYRNTI